MQKPLICSLFMITVLLFSGVCLCEEPPEVSFGIVPQQSASKLARLWGPLLVEVGKKSGCTILFKTATDIPVFEKRLSEGQYDFSYMNPYHYTVFHVKPGYRAFAKEKDKNIQGIIVVLKESPLKDIGELKGSTLAFPAPAAFAASLLPRAHFKKIGLDITPKYVASHDSVYRSVQKGLYPAGGGVQRTFNNVDEKIRNDLKILWRTDKYTPHAFASHPRVPDVLVKKVQKALIELYTYEKGRELLMALNFKNGLETAADSDWDDVRSLKIDQLNRFLKNR